MLNSGMKIRIISAIIFCNFFTSLPAGSNMVPDSTNIIIPFADTYKKIANLSIKDIQKLIGRKLTLKERISFFILKQKLRHKPKDSMNAGDISLILGIAGLVFIALYFFLPFSLVLAIASGILAIVTG